MFLSSKQRGLTDLWDDIWDIYLLMTHDNIALTGTLCSKSLQVNEINEI